MVKAGLTAVLRWRRAQAARAPRRRARGRTAPRPDARGRPFRRRRDRRACGRPAARGDSRAPKAAWRRRHRAAGSSRRRRRARPASSTGPLACALVRTLARPERGIALGLDIARARDAGGDLARAFRGRRQDQIGGGDRRHFDVQVDAVEQRAGQPRPDIRRRSARSARAGRRSRDRWRCAAAAGIHRRHQHEARRIGDAVIGARDRHLAALQRLAQRVRAPARKIPAARRGTARRYARARFRPAARAGRRRPAPAWRRNDAARGTAAGW